MDPCYQPFDLQFAIAAQATAGSAFLTGPGSPTDEVHHSGHRGCHEERGGQDEGAEAAEDVEDAR